MLALAIPWILLTLLIIIVLLLLKKKWCLSISFFIIVLVINWWGECVPLRFWDKNNESEVPSLKVMCFNINSSDAGSNDKPQQIKNLIKKCDPDVVFLSEFADYKPQRLDSLLKLDFSYNTFPSSLCNHYFYSKYPLIDFNRLVIEGLDDEPGVFACSILLNNETIRIFGCHLASNNYTKSRDYLSPKDIHSVKNAFRYLENIKSADLLRRNEAKALIHEMQKTECPIIVMGDFNDVGGSSVIKMIERSGLKDVWWQGCAGYGATIRSPLPYRIDHIFYNPNLTLLRVKKISSEGLSDHDALYAEFAFQ